MRLTGKLAIAGAVLACFAGTAQAQLNVKIGVLTDMSSLYADDNGQGSVVAAKMAVKDFDPAAHGMNVEVVKVLGPGEIDVRFCERGVGETMSSGKSTSGTWVSAPSSS